MLTKVKNIITVVLISGFILSFLIVFLVTDAKESSISERRKLAQFPKLNKETVLNTEFMSEFESYTLDQFPLRDKFRTLKATVLYNVMQMKDNNDIYVVDGYASKLDYPLNVDSLDYASRRIGYVYDKYLKDTEAKVYMSIIPDKNYFLAEKNGYPALDYNKLVEVMQEKNQYASYIDIFPTLELKDYYKTDTHWRQERINLTAAKLAEGMNIKFVPNRAMIEVSEPFYGVYYGQAALPMEPEKLYYVESSSFADCKVFDYETNSEMPVYDMEKLKSPDLYEIYLSGSKSLITIENPFAVTDRELIIFRDSFGSSIAPYFIDSYSKITIIDIRYIHPDVLGNFVKFNNQDVLFLYSTLVLNNSVTFK